MQFTNVSVSSSIPNWQERLQFFFTDIDEISQAQPNEVLRAEILACWPPFASRRAGPSYPERQGSEDAEAKSRGLWANCTRPHASPNKPRMKEAFLNPGSAWFFPFVGGS